LAEHVALAPASGLAAWWERLEDRFEAFVRRTRTDTLCLTIPGLPAQVAVYCLEMLICGDRMTRKALAACQGERPPAGCRAAISPGQFLKAHGISYRISAGSLESIPATGAVIVVANHPYGVIEAAVAFDIVMRVRQDPLALVNFSFVCNPLVRPYMEPIDFRGRPGSAGLNVRSLLRFKAHLKAGGLGFIAPAGAVSTRDHLSREAADIAWNASAARLAIAHGATVVPAFIGGEASRLFHVASKISPVLRLAVMMLENYRLRNKDLWVAIGEPVPPETLAQFASPEAAIAFLRARTDALRADIPA
jgi:putative hemolysin